MSKTEAEVTLNIKAEYKQALIAIANMSKALKALQAQANIMLNVGNTGTPDGKTGRQANSASFANTKQSR